MTKVYNTEAPATKLAAKLSGKGVPHVVTAVDGGWIVQTEEEATTPAVAAATVEVSATEDGIELTPAPKAKKAKGKAAPKKGSPKKKGGAKADSKKRARPAKDPNAPKRPTTAYFYFSADKREDIVAKNPGIKVTDVAKKIGEQWGALSEHEKKKYNDKAAADKDRYNREIANYTPPEGADSDDDGGGKRRKTKKQKDPNAPKRAMTAYFFFLADKREEVMKANPDLKVTELSKRVGEMWGKISDKEKEKYNELNRKDKERYEREMASYKPK